MAYRILERAFRDASSQKSEMIASSDLMRRFSVERNEEDGYNTGADVVL